MSDFEYHSPVEAENAVCELVSLLNEDRKQELIRLIYYFLTEATDQFINAWLYMLLISLYPTPSDIEELKKSDEAFWAGFSKHEVSIIGKTINYFLNQYPRVMHQKEKNKLWEHWQLLRK